MAKSSAKVFRSKVFTTPPVRAVFPKLHEVDQYGAFAVAVDVLDNPELKAVFEKQALMTTAEGQQKLETKKNPTNQIFRQGEYKAKDADSPTPFERIQFKMKSTRLVKGKEVKQFPRVVDSQHNATSEAVFGGSLVRIGYQFQYTVTPTGCFISPKLVAVQVLEHVGPGGEASIGSMFGAPVEGGYVAAAAVLDDSGDEDESAEEAQSGRDF